MAQTKHAVGATLGLALLAAAVAAPLGTAVAQMLDEPYSFRPRDRAGIAALIRQVEEDDGGNGGAVAAAPPPAQQTINVCFSGDGQSEAAGNKECIILNEADGTISTDQDASGDQSADADSSSTVESAGALSDALEGMAQE